MPSSPTELREAAPAPAWRHPFRGFLKRQLPRSLFARSLIIIVAPMVLFQLVVTYLFFERHYEFTTERLARSVSANIAMMIGMHEALGGNASWTTITDTASDKLGLQITYARGETLPDGAIPNATTVDRILRQELTSRLERPFWFTDNQQTGYVDIRVALDDGVLRVLSERKFVVATNWYIFLAWMVLASVLLIAIAVIFLRNQVRPIQRLAYAAEEFGKGRDVPDFRPSGATEVRAAASAFIDMRDRLKRHIQQRTEMLAGVSHDLRTPLTRMKLELAMMESAPSIADLRKDVRDMEHMLEEYLAFARGQGGEVASETDVKDLIEEVANGALRGDGEGRVTVTTNGDLIASVRRNAIKRCIGNLLENALKYGKHAKLDAKRADGAIEVTIEDDGPGIAPEHHEEVFRPFRRLDEARNLDQGGVGLGLAIARDIARGHGGDIILGRSTLGGLRAELRIPV
jgi:two-component system osmolarity sensor histidine kinase EnvZ